MGTSAAAPLGVPAPRNPAAPASPAHPVPSELHYERIIVDGEELHLVSHAILGSPTPDPLAALPRALGDVARLALTGHDTQSIARARGTSPRTVEKQLETLYRRLGVSSRTELITRFGTTWLPK